MDWIREAGRCFGPLSTSQVLEKTLNHGDTVNTEFILSVFAVLLAVQVCLPVLPYGARVAISKRIGATTGTWTIHGFGGLMLSSTSWRSTVVGCSACGRWM